MVLQKFVELVQKLKSYHVTLLIIEIGNKFFFSFLNDVAHTDIVDMTLLKDVTLITKLSFFLILSKPYLYFRYYYYYFFFDTPVKIAKKKSKNGENYYLNVYVPYMYIYTSIGESDAVKCGENRFKAS